LTNQSARSICGFFKFTIRLWARDFYEVIADEAEGRITYHRIEIEN